MYPRGCEVVVFVAGVLKWSLCRRLIMQGLSNAQRREQGWGIEKEELMSPREPDNQREDMKSRGARPLSGASPTQSHLGYLQKMSGIPSHDLWP